MTFDELCDVIGEEAARLLARYAGGSRVYLPRLPRTVRRDACEMHSRGVRIEAIAASIGRSPRHIRRLLSSPE
ncbi:AraC-like DNA-binding protein [Desulfobaculum xiamenense]|uniref:AraC-like DNA-binding protein n=1 Tax=Desulfobaculum xiamenense TaxID=995050 RepID=A0A846QQN0_9BACT|nr:hypothetical protein [Desulfobaculum xiamenense]NJB67514.1 AraC-like DNA-binding protein [Desulfobaculum xiamenense]